MQGMSRTRTGSSSLASALLRYRLFRNASESSRDFEVMVRPEFHTCPGIRGPLAVEALVNSLLMVAIGALTRGSKSSAASAKFASKGTMRSGRRRWRASLCGRCTGAGWPERRRDSPTDVVATEDRPCDLALDAVGLRTVSIGPTHSAGIRMQPPF